MANSDNLFKKFNNELNITTTKSEQIKKSSAFLRDRIREAFKKDHPGYEPTFYIQGSGRIKNRIRTKDDTCDLDDGIYFKANPDDVTGYTLQTWVKNAVTGITNSTPSHRKKCITVDYQAGYNIDLPIFVFDSSKDLHPKLAVKGEDFKTDDPKEFVIEFNRIKDSGGQLIRITRYLKAWCDYKREKMPSGLCMTVLAMEFFEKNDRDDVALKYTLISIESYLKNNFSCVMPTTPQDDLFADYEESRKNNFMNNLASFITDATKAVDIEQNQLAASKLWQKHFGKTYFPDGKDEAVQQNSASSLVGVIGSSKPYYE